MSPNRKKFKADIPEENMDTDSFNDYNNWQRSGILSKKRN